MEEAFYTALWASFFAVLTFIIRGLYHRVQRVDTAIGLFRIGLLQIEKSLLDKPSNDKVLPPDIFDSHLPVIIKSRSLLEVYTEYRTLYGSWISGDFAIDDETRLNSRMSAAQSLISQLNRLLNRVWYCKLMVALKLE